MVDKLQQAEVHKLEGNEHFKAGNYPKALSAYHKVFCYIKGLQVPCTDRHEILDGNAADGGANRNKVPKENVEELRRLKQSTYLNMALCYLRIAKHQKCLDVCTSALTYGEHAKAYFRRAQAHAELRNFVAAQQDFERAQEMTPGDAAILTEMKKLRAASAEADESEKRTCAKMLGVEEQREQQQRADRGKGNNVRGSNGYVDGSGNGNGEPDSRNHVGAKDDDRSSRPQVRDAPAEKTAKIKGAPQQPPAEPRSSPATASASATASADASASTAAQPRPAPPTPTPSPSAAEGATSTRTAMPGAIVQPTQRDAEALDEVGRPEVAVRELIYSWQQTEDEVKIYIPFDQSAELSGGVDQSHVKVEFGEWNFLLVIDPESAGSGDAKAANAGRGRGKLPLGLRLGDFHRRIAPEKCSCTVRGSRITLKLVKQAKERWWNLLQRAPLHAD